VSRFSGLCGVVVVWAACVMPAAAQQVGGLRLDLLGQDGVPAIHVVPVAGTLIVSRNDMTASGAAEPADKLDLVFGPVIWADKSVLQWLAARDAHASAVFTVAVGRQGPVAYTLTGISLRSLSITAQGGEGQASFVLGAAHVSVGGTAIN
jgi:hypothetical protein